MSTIIQVTDALVARLNAGEFSQEFTAERKYQPVYDLPELTDLRVTVVPKAVIIATASRHDSFYDCTVDVGIQKKVSSDSKAEVDPLVNLVEEIADHLRLKRMDELPDAVWMRIENDPVFAPELLDQERVFTAVLTVTYRVRR
jgi:hypothetical protein